jgi:hypothetical protein
MVERAELVRDASVDGYVRSPFSWPISGPSVPPVTGE